MKTSKPVITKPVEKEDMPAKKVVTEKKEKETSKAVKQPVESPKPVEKQPPVVRATVRPGSSRATESKPSAKTVIQTVSYQPEFTKSVLDQPDAVVGPVYRYSDSELGEFKDIILKKLDAAKKELVYLQGLITRKDEAGTDDTENKYMSMEDGSGSQEREQLNQMASRQIQFIDHLEKALMRIENKTYGICRVTGKLIDKARLKAVPHATLSIEAKLAKSK
ncbi:TraR/DksA C4-type zinc finger protein [Chitinophaga sedimenti]|uniref:TraR/DksA family transcriptional regulator n=1 Tax=Chitinophaga sedimenti TaxID=2033606 RepID=UPI002004B9EC|nr:TraR/DksA C4-type zinc finger protein [Chitinophaga sedimenti]MCK7559005.1 TraR/DksA C4-type zinc finger protein [Chitinophaga sedimenti]